MTKFRFKGCFKGRLESRLLRLVFARLAACSAGTKGQAFGNRFEFGVLSFGFGFWGLGTRPQRCARSTPARRGQAGGFFEEACLCSRLIFALFQRGF